MIDLKKALAIFALATAVIAGVVLAQGGPGKAGINTGGDVPAQRPAAGTVKLAEETCPADTADIGILSSCFMEKFYARLNKGGDQMNAELSTPFGKEAEEATRNLMTGMAGFFALGQKCMSDVAANMTAFTRTGSPRQTL